MVKALRLKLPLSEKEIRSLKAGDIIYLSGSIVTARDAAHRRMINHIKMKRLLPISLKGSAIYHCGPIMRRINGRWAVISAGPTTSMRMEPFESEIIKELGVRLIIGKGGMGLETTRAMKNYGAVYGAFTGGAGVLAARFIKRVLDVKWLDLGMPEAMWTFLVEDFGPLVVAIDSHGNNLYNEVRVRARRIMDNLLERC
ncbi:fumarate hydratase [Candidatus Woesearchaeota archaeon]|nr:MAG: fumarate hydratase [Candidatus Woesearchaeota archaeon]